jgi:hypothetical protein
MLHMSKNLHKVPEDNKDQRPKHITAIINKKTVQKVGVKRYVVA